MESLIRTDETPFSSLSTAFVRLSVHNRLLCWTVDIKYAKCFLGTDQFYERESRSTGAEAAIVHSTVQHRSASCGNSLIL